MTQFWVLASVLAAVALAFMLVPLWQYRRRSGHASPAAVLLAIATVPVAVVVYLQTTTWVPSGTAETAPDVEQMIEALAARLEQAPENVEGWRLLGRSYLSLGRYAAAEQALRQAWARTPVPDSELKLALAEAQVLQNPENLSGEAGRLFEEVLSSDPQNMKALWYSGLAALEAQQNDTVRDRWGRLLALGPPPAIAQILEAQLAELGGLEVGVSAGGGRDTPGQPAALDAGPTLAIEIDVRVAQDLALPALGPEAALFIFARAPTGGPPVAVVRAGADAVPGRVVLSDADAMLPGRSLRDFQELTLVARLSLSGQPTGAPGDLYGETKYRPGLDSGPIPLVINRVE